MNHFTLDGLNCLGVNLKNMDCILMIHRITEDLRNNAVFGRGMYIWALDKELKGLCLTSKSIAIDTVLHYIAGFVIYLWFV